MRRSLPGMCGVAAGRYAEQVEGQLGHDGTDRSSPGRPD